MVVLKAAGARPSGQAGDGTLEKIERSGRQALTEMRRLLGMLREPDEEPALAPQPGLGELPALAESVRAAGLPVRLVVDGNDAATEATQGGRGLTATVKSQVAACWSGMFLSIGITNN